MPYECMEIFIISFATHGKKISLKQRNGDSV